MTTIAYRAGVMVGDGRETMQNDEHSSWYKLRDNCVKIYRLPDGSLFGGAHGSEDIERLYLALKNGHPAPKLEDVAGLHIDRRGRMWIYEGNIWQSLKGFKFYAIGSGAIMATAAMMAGASALEAVKIACQLDLWSGGKLTTLKLHR